MTNIIVANIIDFIGAMIQIGSGAFKKKDKILIAQIVQLAVQSVSLLILGGITGFISNIISCFRNYVCYKGWMNTPFKIVFLAASAILTGLFNKQGWFGWIPFAVCAVYIIFMDIKDPIRFKLLVTLTFIPWVFYYFVLKSYTGSFFAAATVITNTIALRQMVREDRKKADDNPPAGSV